MYNTKINIMEKSEGFFSFHSLLVIILSWFSLLESSLYLDRVLHKHRYREEVWIALLLYSVQISSLYFTCRGAGNTMARQ